MTPIVSLKSVSRAYSTGSIVVTAVRNVTFDVLPGERVAVMGPSGSGKSTLMNMIGLLDQPSDGAIFLEGANVASLSEDEKSRLRATKIGFVFQSYNLLARHSAIENVALPLFYSHQRRLRQGQRLAKAAEALARVGMLGKAKHYPAQLSGGEQQRVAIARALVASPAVLLADEPTGALDSRTGNEILSLFRSLNHAGQTVVLITHDAAVAAQCKRTIRLHDGEVVADDTHLPAIPRREMAS
jgi:putative ABC transport system ATP-binding protein